MNSKQAIATEIYEIVYANPIKLVQGEQVRVLKYETAAEWKGWVFCVDSRGVEGWVSETYLKIENQTARVLKNYDATEVALSENEVVEVTNEEFGWAWVRKSTGEVGWVPLKNLRL